jgi:hypothetical protein
MTCVNGPHRQPAESDVGRWDTYASRIFKELIDVVWC